MKKEERKEFTKLEKITLKRLKERKGKVKKKKIKKASKYVQAANNLFFNTSKSLENKGMFDSLRNDLRKSNLQFVLPAYISVILFTTLISVFIGLFAFIFFLFFNLEVTWPIITLVDEGFGTRFIKVFWILFLVPLGTFLIMYFYPNMEKKSSESRINQELPFATIHMASISNSMVEPSKIFHIIITTEEYPYIIKEFIKLINKVNVQGYDLVSALRSSAFNSPSRKLSELFNGLATTITSGGDLPEFFDKRAETLLFEHRLEREKYTRTAETFMDIYISVVIAAPMILMLLLIMMKVSGLGIGLSLSTITLLMVVGIAMINVFFITFLYLKQPR